MEARINKGKFLRNWTLLNATILIIAYPICFLIGLSLADSMTEWGTYYEQTRDMIIYQSVTGFLIGIIQWFLLKRIFNISSLWISTIPIVVIVIEVIVGLILANLDINRGDLTFLEGDPYSHAIILGITGLFIGVIQIPLLRKYLSGTIYWVLASTFAWAISVLITAIGHRYDIMVLITFILGSLLYGAITGVTLMWILKPKGI